MEADLFLIPETYPEIVFATFFNDYLPKRSSVAEGSVLLTHHIYGQFGSIQKNREINAANGFNKLCECESAYYPYAEGKNVVANYAKELSDLILNKVKVNQSNLVCMAILGSGGHLCAEKEGKIIEQLIESVQVNIFIVDSSQEYIRAASDVLKKISNNIKVKSVCKPFIGIGNLLADSKLVTKDTFLVTTCLGITTGNEAFQEKDVVFLENILSFSGRTLSKQALVLLDYDGNLDLLERKKAYDNPIIDLFRNPDHPNSML